jgi:mannan endo-1,4-beta-mannosidase
MLKLVLFALLVGQVVGDSISSIDYGGRIGTTGTFDVLVSYNSDGSRDLEVSLKKPSEKNKEYASAKVKCDKGYDRKKSLSVTIKSGLTAGTGYVVEIKLVKVTALVLKEDTASKIVNVTVNFGRQGFYVADGILYDANANQFLVRGISNAHAEYDTGSRWLAREALVNIAYARANTVRIMWKKSSSLSVYDLDVIIGRALKSNLIPIVELHDAVGSNDASKLNELATWWADNVWLLVKYRKYIIVNIASEWGSEIISDKFWKDSYKDAITIVRDAGFSGTLLIDSYGGAQNPSGPRTYAQRLLEHDDYANLIFGLHLFSDWSQRIAKYQIVKELEDLKSQRIPILIGSFADKYPAKVNGICVETIIDANTILKEALKLKIGFTTTYWAGLFSVCDHCVNIIPNKLNFKQSMSF